MPLSLAEKRRVRRTPPQFSAAAFYTAPPRFTHTRYNCCANGYEILKFKLYNPSNKHTVEWIYKTEQANWSLAAQDM